MERTESYSFFHEGTDSFIRRGEAHHAAKLTESVVRRMRSMVEDDGLCMRCVATIYGVNYQTAFDAITRRTWRHIK